MHTPEEHENLLKMAKEIIEQLEFSDERDNNGRYDWQSDIHYYCPICHLEDEHSDGCIIKLWKDLL